MGDPADFGRVAAFVCSRPGRVRQRRRHRGRRRGHAGPVEPDGRFRVPARPPCRRSSDAGERRRPCLCGLLPGLTGPPGCGGERDRTRTTIPGVVRALRRSGSPSRRGGHGSSDPPRRGRWEVRFERRKGRRRPDDADRPGGGGGGSFGNGPSFWAATWSKAGTGRAWARSGTANDGRYGRRRRVGGADRSSPSGPPWRSRRRDERRGDRTEDGLPGFATAGVPTWPWSTGPGRGRRSRNSIPAGASGRGHAST